MGPAHYTGPKPASKPPALSVVFSFRNEAEVLPELIRRTRTVLKAQRDQGAVGDFELIFVNDDSTDASLQILTDHQRECDFIRVINMSRNYGVAPCVMAGLAHARGDAVVYMDADLQDPPETIPRLIEAWKSDQADVVHTVRLSREGEYRIKMWITRLGYYLLRRMATIDLKIEAGDFKLLSRRAVTHLLEMKEHQPYVRGLVSWIGFPQTTIEYHRAARFAGRTKFPTLCSDVLRAFFDSALISFTDIPLKISIVLGFLVSMGALGYSGYIVLEKFRGHNIPGWSAIMVTMLFLGAMQQFTIGFLAAC